MKYPTLPVLNSSRQVLDVFRGYRHSLRPGDGEFYDMENMTSDGFPVLCPRGKRGVYLPQGNPRGMIAKDALCYVDGGDFVMNEYRVDMGLTDSPKQLVSMGAYVIILPDKKWINTLDLTDFGSMEASFTSGTDVNFTLCDRAGVPYEGVTVSGAAPADPDNMALWMDTGSTPHVLKQYSAAGAMWVSIPDTYVKISAPGIGASFDQFDGVALSGITEVPALNGAAVIWAKDENSIVVVGLLDENTVQRADAGPVTVARRVPEMDFVVESGNRLWGCRYGLSAAGQVVNELYACKLGDFKNWNCFMGISTDSYAVSIGSDGPFTGAITHLGYPLFFKENCLHKVYGNYPSNFQVQTTPCRGVQAGCGGSLAIVGETLFYKGRSGILAYDGSLPQDASSALGNVAYASAVAGAVGDKYYVSMVDAQGAWHLFVLDTARGLWHREDKFHASAFCPCRGELYAIDADSGRILAMLGSGEPEPETVGWMVETGEIALSSPDMKYLHRLTVRMSMEIGAQARFLARYDGEETWAVLCSLVGRNLRSFAVSIRPRRCDHMRIRIEGRGNVKIYSVAKTMEAGSDFS